jgi:hypothetical protein
MCSGSHGNVIDRTKLQERNLNYYNFGDNIPYACIIDVNKILITNWGQLIPQP